MTKRNTATTMTPKQRAIYDFIASFAEAHQMPPSLREIGSHFDLSVGTVQDQVEALRRKGFIGKHTARARGLQMPIVPSRVAVLGRVHAGPLHAALENIEGYLPVDKTVDTARHFGLRVRGDSMIGDGIVENDWVIVRAQPTAEDGQIVVARIDDETTVKRLRHRDGRIVLEPANPHYKAIEGPFDIVGVVVEVRRRYDRT